MEIKYSLGWICSKGPKARVTKVYTLKFIINSYIDQVTCDVIDMDCYDIHIGRPIQYDRNAQFNTRANTYLLDKEETLY